MEREERRQFFRHLLVSPLKFQITENDKTEEVATVNVSEGGLMFTSIQKVEEGARITLHMPLYDKTFNVKATVVHVAKDKETNMYNVGVSFVTYSDAFKVKLIEQIYLIEEYRVLRSLQLGRDMTLQEASEEWVKRYSERFRKLYW